ncbi:hypothetical protein IAU59_003224 [Kwoniella sp. CBS 9459]
MSLHTLTPGTLSKAQQQRLVQLVQGSIRAKSQHGADIGAHGDNDLAGPASGNWRRLVSTDDNEGSFFTARGTVRSIKPKSADHAHDDQGEEVEEKEVLVLVHERGQSTSNQMSSTSNTPASHSQEWSYGESPYPSRVLYLFHPPSSSATNNETSLINPLSLSLTSLSGAGNVNLDAWSWLDSAKESLECAFWGILMPSVSGVMGVSEKVSSGLATFITLLPVPATLAIEGSVAWQASTSVKTEAEEIPRTWARDATYKFRASASLRGSPVSSPHSSPTKHRAALPGIGIGNGSADHPPNPMMKYTPRLYDQETLYTLRFAPTPALNGENVGPDSGLGPTMKPVHVKKRASLPWHSEQQRGWDDGKREIGLGMAPGGGMGLGMGMRV